ncbi:MAG: tetratricopeptide repeat protein [Microcoleus sp. PH2017_25_DOB_D_A]|uniref:tetratricopeptide repeat protein n=1 Tax=unclassified Microcoleus TaxID=2642155 RepID=UPI001D5F4D74|nr:MULTISPECIES: tetratricopeptide repeat protein [unclassified Microcoleus]MCC3535000.1 tetratricopeptide repeat protein [Microcoleus sp. PH2017_25_DOB_D_A]MCC3547289.1 tetratricopeptide repeat protein [Microcoleus sp. PH2017_24_DOB_U_A]TAE43481.1 MAG: tetratricopeptide repeat protein [Oscillatoriales cyanobacterium]
MEADQALDFTNSLLVARNLKTLDNLDSAIFREAWMGVQGRTYQQVAESEGYGVGTVKDAASNLWKRLSALFGEGEKVKRDNLQAVIDRYWRSYSKLEPQSGQIVPPRSSLGLDSDLEIENPNFLGRFEAIEDLNTLVAQGAKVIVIQSAGGMGKTTLARQYLKSQGFDRVIELLMAKETENLTALESAIEEWLKQDFQEEPGPDFGVTLGRLKRQLQTLKVGVLIDNLEAALDGQGKFIEPHRLYVELLRVLADAAVQSVTLITSRDRLCDSDVTVEHYLLPGLDVETWQQYFGDRNIKIDPVALQEMHKVYGGNAKAMGILWGTIREDFDGDMAAYWLENSDDPLVETDLKNLVTSQFNRLQELDPEAYQLLCRLGCYRYQDVPTVPSDALLCLLWDVPEAGRRQIIKSLLHRSLVESQKGEYWVHPAIREEAVDRLSPADWDTANRKAAEFWTDSVEIIETVEDALKAFEAYYHYVAISCFEQAASVILKKINIQFAKDYKLGRALYKLGFLQPIISATTRIVNNVTSDYYLSGLYSILGVSYRILGDINQAIECHQISERKATKCLQNIAKNSEPENGPKANLEFWKLNAAINIGFCKIEMLELEPALEIFVKMKNSREEIGIIGINSYSIEVGLAFLNSCVGVKKAAKELADKLYADREESQLVGTGYKLVFLATTYKNLGDPEKALSLYSQAIAQADENLYSTVKAKALSGIAALYRERGEFDQAMQHHAEAIEILDLPSAKLDRAEACYQLALTEQKLGNIEKAQENFDRAIQLFSEMDASKQVEKVQFAATKNPEKIPN